MIKMLWKEDLKFNRNKKKTKIILIKIQNLVILGNLFQILIPKYCQKIMEAVEVENAGRSLSMRGLSEFAAIEKNLVPLGKILNDITLMDHPSCLTHDSKLHAQRSCPPTFPTTILLMDNPYRTWVPEKGYT